MTQPIRLEQLRITLANPQSPLSQALNINPPSADKTWLCKIEEITSVIKPMQANQKYLE